MELFLNYFHRNSPITICLAVNVIKIMLSKRQTNCVPVGSVDISIGSF